MTNETISLDEFVTTLKVHVDIFAAHWRNMHQVAPDLWPLEDSPLSWHEQFISYIEGTNDHD